MKEFKISDARVGRLRMLLGIDHKTCKAHWLYEVEKKLQKAAIPIENKRESL